MTTCTHHGDLMRDYALGKLDDDRALEAEVARAQCAECSVWWNDTFAPGSVALIDSAVGEAFAAFDPPARRHTGWLAAAAALILAVGLSSVVLIPTDSGPAMMSSLPETAAEAGLVSLDFEDGSLQGIEVVNGTVETADEGAETALFVNDLESGDLAGWTING